MSSQINTGYGNGTTTLANGNTTPIKPTPAPKPRSSK